MSGRPPLPFASRVLVWDAALNATREVLRGQGMAEVVTPVRLQAVAVEPFIEPLAAPPGVLATSPELPMKRLLCRGAPSIFQIAPCFRAAEHGALHREEFHMIEWYRVASDTDALRRDVEAVVAAVHDAVAGVLDEPAIVPPQQWLEVGVVDLMSQTLGLSLRGDEDAPRLAAALAPVSARLGHPLATLRDDRLASSPRAHSLAAWTAFFSAWCDTCLDPWLDQRRQLGVHVGQMPAPLAALSEVGPAEDGSDRALAHRFESYAHGRELANGYRELRDPNEQLRRFQDVNTLRASMDQPPLPIDPEFLADLRSPGLPPCAGVALGLDRLVLLATGRTRLGDIAIELGAPPR
ncbi:MAG: amino acid--tRNA ligase-related protein [Myxococcota bacterium]